jgi:hypothetical protein
MKRYTVAATLALACLSFTAAVAQLTGMSGTILVEHGVYQVGPGFPFPMYNLSGFLLSPGANYPLVQNPTIVSTSFLNFVTGSPGIAFLSWATAPAGQFGGASTSMYSLVAPNRGLLWWNNYMVRDVPSNDGVGTYNASGGDVVFQNGPIPQAGRAGIYFPFAGFAVGPNAYVAGAMLFEMTILNAANAIVNQFIMGVHFGFDGLGPRSDGVFVFGTAPAFWGWAFQSFGTSFRGYGLAWTPVTIPAGGKFILEGRLTLLADPDSGFDIDNSFDNDPNVIANLPEFGYTTVPEPASMTALGVGLLAILARRRRTA